MPSTPLRTRQSYKKSISIDGGWDKRDPDPKKDYGIHGCQLRFLLEGKEGFVSFVLYTDWMPLAVQKERMGKDVASTTLYPSVCQVVTGVQPTGADIGYHSPKPLRPWQKPSDMGKCDLVAGGKCYYDGSGLAAEVVRDAMLVDGDKGIWREMQKYYRAQFQDFDKLTMDDANFGDLIQAFVGEPKKGDKADGKTT